MKNSALRIAVTGNIGSGKSTFCDFIESRGYIVIKADDLAKDILANDEKAKTLIIKSFGSESYKNGKPNKVFLSEKVFSNNKKLLEINSIIHPLVFKKLEKIFNENSNNKIIFVEAALIYEANMEDMFDYVVLICSKEDNRKNRKIKADKMTGLEFDKRNGFQIPEAEKKKRADFIFDNDSTLTDLKQKAELLLMMIAGKINP
ncbi:MAG TPA: dephospho-CoA kinase [Ignavibacteriaceae bacterium]|nr:dephospho-CoA kinase [Ignavibacteriaceae bacterium]